MDRKPSELHEISKPFPKGLVRKPAPGKHGKYVSHPDVTQRALSIVGPHSFEVTQTIRGYIPEWKKDGKVLAAPREGIVGVIGTLSVTIDGRDIVISEVGDVENPQMENDGANAKKAASDAYKRCWMRTGLGLHLWCVRKDGSTEVSTYSLQSWIEAVWPELTFTPEEADAEAEKPFEEPAS